MHRVGLFGGTFNPIHYGHLRVAEEVREALALHRLWLIPSRDPPHKDSPDIAPISHRLEMVRLAAPGHTAFSVCDFEASRPETSYSLYTIRHYRGLVGPEAQIFFIMGTDAFAEITTWHKWEDVLAECDLAVMMRPGSAKVRPSVVLPPEVAARYVESEPDVFVAENGRRIQFVPVTLLDISSSDMRRRRSEGLSLAFLTPQPVVDYLREHGIYK
jgi:nicotinate-nucleotide adenylyltransferase